MAEAGAKAGADLIVVETMTDLYEAKAALLAAKEAAHLPVFVTMSFDAGGRTFTGCTVASMARTLEGLGADAIGLFFELFAGARPAGAAAERNCVRIPACRSLPSLTRACRTRWMDTMIWDRRTLPRLC